jgi:hypothetical protein
LSSIAFLLRNAAIYYFMFNFFLLAQEPPVDHGLVLEVPRSHTTTHHSR